MSEETAPRRYRFGQRRRAGLFGTLPPALVGVGLIGLAVAWLGVRGVLPAPVVIVVVGGCGWLGFGRLRGRPAHEILPAMLRWWWRRLRSRHHWYRPVPLLTDGEMPIAVPAVLSGIELYEVSVDWLAPGDRVPIGVVRDRQAGTLTAVLRVCGDGQFGLVDQATQELRVDEWGSAIGGFVRENTLVARVTFHDWTSPVPVGDTITRLAQVWADEAPHPARADYLELLTETSATVVDHDVLVEVTLDLARLGHVRGETNLSAGMRALAEQTRQFSARLDAAGLRVEAVLSAAELVTATRVRSDPSVVEQLTALRRSLAAATGTAAPAFGPMLVIDDIESVRVDRAVHRSWWFVRWPRREVPAAWMDGLVFDSGCTRTVTVVFEPVAPSRSDRDVDTERTKREANIETRRRKGFLVRRVDTKAVTEVEAREDELVSGFAEFCYTGLVTVTAPSVDELDLRGADMEQAAANVGVELQPLWGRQADGWVASLPLGRNLARRLGDR